MNYTNNYTRSINNINSIDDGAGGVIEDGSITCNNLIVNEVSNLKGTVNLGDKLLQTNPLNNIYIGNCFSPNNIGKYNIAIGNGAGLNDCSGSENVGIGYGTLRSCYGDGNLAFGTFSGGGNRYGSRCSFLGSCTTTDGGGNESYNDSTAVGFGVEISASNQIKLGRDTETVQIDGKLSVLNDVSFNSRLDVSGNLSIKGKMTVLNDVSFNSRLDVSGNITGRNQLKIFENSSYVAEVIVGDFIIRRRALFNDVEFYKQGPGNYWFYINGGLKFQIETNQIHTYAQLNTNGFPLGCGSINCGSINNTTYPLTTGDISSNNLRFRTTLGTTQAYSSIPNGKISNVSSINNIITFFPNYRLATSTSFPPITANNTTIATIVFPANSDIKFGINPTIQYYPLTAYVNPAFGTYKNSTGSTLNNVVYTIYKNGVLFDTKTITYNLASPTTPIGTGDYGPFGIQLAYFQIEYTGISIETTYTVNANYSMTNNAPSGQTYNQSYYLFNANTTVQTTLTNNSVATNDETYNTGVVVNGTITPNNLTTGNITALNGNLNVSGNVSMLSNLTVKGITTTPTTQPATTQIGGTKTTTISTVQNITTGMVMYSFNTTTDIGVFLCNFEYEYVVPSPAMGSMTFRLFWQDGDNNLTQLYRKDNGYTNSRAAGGVAINTESFHFSTVGITGLAAYQPVLNWTGGATITLNYGQLRLTRIW